jgi:hypothetical protein
MLSFKPCFGRANDHQGWQTINESLSKGDVYAISAANINDQLTRMRCPHKEVSPDDFKVAVPSNKLILLKFDTES